MTPAVRAQYLQQLGIVAYVPRTESSPAFKQPSIRKENSSPPLEKGVRRGAPLVRPSEAGDLLNSFSLEGSQNAFLIFLLQAEILDWATPSHQLLKKIIDAVALPPEAIAICFAPNIPFALPTMNKAAKIIAFGSGLSESSHTNTFQTLSLTELQHNDAAKRALWQELKAIKAAYGH